MLDSGTTFTYLPSEAFAAFRDKVSSFATAKGLHSVKGPDPKFHDICFGGAPHVDHPDQLSSVFPSLELKFAQVSQPFNCFSFEQSQTYLSEVNKVSDHQCQACLHLSPTIIRVL